MIAACDALHGQAAYDTLSRVVMERYDFAG